MTTPFLVFLGILYVVAAVGTTAYAVDEKDFDTLAEDVAFGILWPLWLLSGTIKTIKAIPSVFRRVLSEQQDNYR